MEMINVAERTVKRKEDRNVKSLFSIWLQTNRRRTFRMQTHSILMRRKKLVIELNVVENRDARMQPIYSSFYCLYSIFKFISIHRNEQSTSFSLNRRELMRSSVLFMVSIWMRWSRRTKKTDEMNGNQFIRFVSDFGVYYSNEIKKSFKKGFKSLICVWNGWQIFFLRSVEKCNPCYLIILTNTLCNQRWKPSVIVVIRAIDGD